MNVSVNFFGIQRKIIQQNRIDVWLADRARVSDLLQHIRKYYPALILNEDSLMITVNDRISSLDQDLNLNDSVSIIPHLGGG